MTATTGRPTQTRADGHIGLILAIAFAVTVVAVTVVFTVASRPPDGFTDLAWMYFCSMYIAVGVLILWRRPRHGMGRLSLFLGVMTGASLILRVLLVVLIAKIPAGIFGPDSFEIHHLSYDLLGMVAESLATLAVAAGLVLIIAWFPAGRVTTRLGEAVQGVLAVAIAILLIASETGLVRTIGWPPLDENQLAIGASLGYAALLTALAGAIVDLSRRYRHGDRLTRVQTRWLVAASIGTFTATIAVFLVGNRFEVIWFIWAASFGFPILAVAIAITRYHLYDIDRIVSRSIAYVVVTSVLLIVFGGLILVLQSVVSGAVAGPGAALDPRAVAASTLVVAALFNPIRTRVQAVVDRRFHRSQYDAERTVASFAGRLRDQLDLPTLTGELRRTTTRAVEPATTDVWLRARAGAPIP